jgi:hypothetical protein
MLKLILPILAATVLIAPIASADDAPMAPAPLAPLAERVTFEDAGNRGMSDERISGIGLTAIGGVLAGAGVLGTVIAFGLGASCEDGPCGSPVSNGAKVGVVALDTVAAGALVIGIVLIVDGARPASPKASASRIRPTANGVGFSF